MNTRVHTNSATPGQLSHLRIVMLIHTGFGSGPTWNMLCSFSKYILNTILFDAVESGVYFPYNQWKRYVKCVVLDKDLRRWKLSCMLYKSLNMLDIENCNHVNPIG